MSVLHLVALLSQVVGVALNGIQHDGDVDEAMKKLETLNDKKFKQIFSMLYDLNQSLNLFERYNVTSIFECRILSVDNRYRGKGLANELFKMSLDIASKAGFKVRTFEPNFWLRRSWKRISTNYTVEVNERISRIPLSISVKRISSNSAKLRPQYFLATLP